MEYNSDYNNDNSIVNDTIFEDARDTLDYDLYAIPDIYYYVKQVYISVIALLLINGVVFNALCIRAFGRDQSIKDTTRFLPQMLTAAEMIFIVLLFVNELFSVPYIYVQRYAPLTMSIAMSSISWLVVLVTFDRYTVLYRPQVAAKYSTLPRVKIAVCIVWTASVILTLPQFFDYEIDGTVLRETHMLNSKIYFIGYHMCLTFTLARLLPLSLNAFFTYRLVLHIRRTGTADRNDDVISNYRPTDGDRQLTTALSIFVAVFDVFQIVLIAESLFHYTVWFDMLFSKLRYRVVHILYLKMIVNCLLFINLSFKVIVFWVTSINYRRSDAFRCSCGSRRPMLASERVDGVFSPTDVSFHGDTVILMSCDSPLIVSE